MNEDLERSHVQAIRGAYQGRGILAPGAGGRKQINCWLASTTLLCFISASVAGWIWGARGWEIYAGAVIGVVAGFYVGDKLFHANFIIDRSLNDWRRDSI